MIRSLRFSCGLAITFGALILLGSTTVWAEEPARPAQYTFGGQLIFWLGALALVTLMARVMFKEQLNERRTLRRLIHEIGPYYPEFDIDRLKHWVHLCAPHVWSGWSSGQVDAIQDFVTDTFRREFEAHYGAFQDKGQRIDCQLLDVLEVHPLGLYMIGDGPAPADTELMLRLEQKAIYQVKDANGRTVDGSDAVRQIQHFWTLRHNGEALQLDRVWLAESDMTDLAQRPIPPDVRTWSRASTSNPTPDP